MSDIKTDNSKTLANALKEIDRLSERVDELTDCLTEAKANMQDWCGYVDSYFLAKHNLKGDLAKIDRALEGDQ